MCFWPFCIEYVIKKESRSKIKFIITLQNYIYSEHHPSLSMTVQQDATKYILLYFCKLFYTFRVFTPLIISGTYNRNYSIWQWSNRLCYLLLSWSSWNCNWSSNFFTTVEGSKDGLTSARCCNYGCMCSWWWVELPPETCRAVYKNIINCI
jgi:hypothetical protein